MDTPSIRHRPPRIFGALLAGVGLVLIVGGSRLLMLGGSPYYVVAGLAWVLSGALLWRRSRLGHLVYGGMLLGTIVWALWKVGFDAWALNDVIALDAESGKEVWRFEVNLQKAAPFLGMRGVAYYKQPETSGACAERILINTQDARLIALDALTGALWGYLSAVDLTTRKLVWSKPLGTARDVGPFGIPTMLPIEIGTPNMGGPLTTRGGLTFIAAAQDNYLRAYDTSTGKRLWQARLPAGGNATPMTYTSPAGRQLVVIAAGGSSIFQTKRGDYVIAYALPEEP